MKTLAFSLFVLLFILSPGFCDVFVKGYGGEASQESLLVITNRRYRSTSRKPFSKFMSLKGATNLVYAHVEDADTKIQKRESKSKWNAYVWGDQPEDHRPAFRKLMQQMKAKEIKHCVLYIHGYRKSFREALARAQKIENLYKVKVICLDWPSEGLNTWNKYKYAQKNGKESAKAVRLVLEQLDQFKKENPQETKGIQFSLFVHSQGNYLLQSLVQFEKANLPKNLITNLVLNAADVDRKNHADWLEKLTNRAKRTYVIFNKKDLVLKSSEVWFLTRNRNERLGRLGPSLKKDENRGATNATYINFAGIGVNHKYFISSIPKKNKPIQNFYHAIFHSKAPSLDKAQGFMLDNGIYILK